MTVLAHPLNVIMDSKTNLICLAAGFRRRRTYSTPQLLEPENGSKKEGMIKNKGKEISIAVPQNLILLSLLLQTSDIHALHTLMYITSFCCPPYFFARIDAPERGRTD